MEKTNETKFERAMRILDSVSIAKVAESLGIETKQRGKNLIVEKCPFCGEKAVMYISPDNGIFKCFRCNEGGSPAALVQKVKKCSYDEALDYLEGLM